MFYLFCIVLKPVSANNRAESKNFVGTWPRTEIQYLEVPKISNRLSENFSLHYICSRRRLLQENRERFNFTLRLY
jgi:hypothetical protein